MAQQCGIPSVRLLKGPQVKQIVSRLLVTLSNVMRVMKLEPCNFGLRKPYDEGVAASNKNIPQLAKPPLRSPAYAPAIHICMHAYTYSTACRYNAAVIPLPPQVYWHAGKTEGIICIWQEVSHLCNRRHRLINR